MKSATPPLNIVENKQQIISKTKVRPKNQEHQIDTSYATFVFAVEGQNPEFYVDKEPNMFITLYPHVRKKYSGRHIYDSRCIYRHKISSGRFHFCKDP